MSSDFNSTKVQFGAVYTAPLIPPAFYFNSTKVQFGVVTGDFKESLTHISIPLRYNLESHKFHNASVTTEFQFH